MIKIHWKVIVIALLGILITACIYTLNTTNVVHLELDQNINSEKEALNASTVLFNQGDIVLYGGEEFYSLYDVASTDDTMELFAKTNLNLAATAQANDVYSNTECAFAGTQYWGDNTGLNLNLEPGYAATDAIGKARSYAKTKGAIDGRLLTKQEVENLTGVTGTSSWSSMTDTTIKDMINGAGNSQGFEYYWLGSGSELYADDVWYMTGEWSSANRSGFTYGIYGGGVRPVLAVNTSDVQAATPGYLAGDVYARLYDSDSDGTGDTLVLSSAADTPYTDGGTLITNYGKVPNDYDSSSSIPWSADRSKIITTKVIDSIKPKKMSYYFYAQSNMTSIVGISNINTSEVTDMKYMCDGCSSLTSLDLSSFNTSNVTNMDSMFFGCSGLTSLNLSNFNTAKVTDMGYMFWKCTGLTSLDLSSFDTSNVTSMYDMFIKCSSLTSLDISNFNTQKVTRMNSMFEECSSLTSLDLSSFNTSSVTSISSMFEKCSSLTTIYASTDFDVSTVAPAYYMFDSCSALVGGKGTTFKNKFKEQTYAHIDGGESDPGYFTDGKNINVTATIGQTSTFDLSKYAPFTTNFTVQTASNTSIATTSVSGNTLFIYGVAQGTTTSILAKTGSNRTITVNISVGILPTVTLATGSYTGTTYTSGTSVASGTNVYHTLSMTGSKTVSKYQYCADNSNTWVDIPDTSTVNESPKTMTFPLSDKPSWLGDVQKGGSSAGYQFAVNGSTLKSNNAGKASSVAHSYIPIDLTGYTSSDSLKVTVNYTISSQSSTTDYGSVALSTSATQAYSSSTGRFIGNVGGSTTTGSGNKTITGGSKYYLHFYYRKNASTNRYDDCFIINSIKLESTTLLTKTTGITLDYSKSGNTVKYYVKANGCNVYKYRAVFSDNTISQETDAYVINGTQVNFGTKAETTVEMGDTVSIGDEQFMVLKRTSSYILAMPYYNITLSTTNPVQTSTWDTTTQCKFASSQYWTEYATNIDMTNSANNIQKYISAYSNKLSNATNGKVTAEVGRYYGEDGLHVYDDLTNDEGISLINPSGIGSAWIGSSYTDSLTHVWYMNKRYASDYTAYYYTDMYGVRPVVYIHRENNNPEESSGIHYGNKTEFTVKTGDTIRIGNEMFMVLKNDASQITAMPYNNITLDTTNPMQSSKADKTAFSSSNYWTQTDTNINMANSANNIQKYISAYSTKLSNATGGMATAEIGTYDVLSPYLGLTYADHLYVLNPTYIGSYWVGTSGPDDANNVLYLGSYSFRSDYTYDNSSKVGVRPVVYIQHSATQQGTGGSGSNYTQGQLVSYKGETFYSLHDADASIDTTMEIFAAYCLQSDGTAQKNDTYSNYACVFSSERYWGSTGQNLNNFPGEGTDLDECMPRIKKYALDKGAIDGRLLTYDEANTINTNGTTDAKNMLWGRLNTKEKNSSNQPYLYYWLGTLESSGSFYMWVVNGEDAEITDEDSLGFGTSGGARPVLRVYTSEVSPVN